MDELRLIYVNGLGTDFEGNDIYEFIFGSEDNLDEVEGDDWDIFPAQHNPTPPELKFITVVAELRSDLSLELVQNSSKHGMYDAVDGVIALAWEDITGYDEYPDRGKVCFKYGDDKKTVDEMLYRVELQLDYEYKNKHNFRSIKD